jgi:arginine decarboxylase
MCTIRVGSGVGRAPTRMASYDAALAATDLHNYNLVTVSSVIPAAATVEEVASMPDLGPAGGRLTVVEARAVVAGRGAAVAGLGWATGPGPGLFYEAVGEEPAAVRERIETGLETGRRLREWRFDDETITTVAADADADGYTTAVVVAAYGRAEPIL